ncbi:binding-protein-dependent transport systems inner membrane component [Methanosalsum zhilinae DSM 4017]|uniref:Binding-protein-dependent transport systems inner membrane component n=2 Tax=Methanosalsum zhilinae TaxID=39669 RepID=F7XNJ3_METZD|nr:binding-protein-dependent transport systems inner membrane component [Methanosalsum zhilinae DSM 4017]
MRIIANRSMVIGMVLAGVMVMVALFAPWLAPNDPQESNLDERLVAPEYSLSSQYPFGTDHLGRCILSRALFATRISLLIGISVISLSLVTGTVIGAVSGYSGGVVDEIIMRVVDAFLSFPGMFVALAVAGIFGGSIVGLVVALTLVEWTVFARISRGSVISVKNMDYVLASKAMGAGSGHILKYHILPNITSPLLVIATLGMGYVILAAASLSFLGLGVSSYPELGMMVSDGRFFLQSAPHVMFFPGMFIVSIVLGFNFIGDGLRDIFDPRDTKQRWRVF